MVYCHIFTGHSFLPGCFGYMSSYSVWGTFFTFSFTCTYYHWGFWRKILSFIYGVLFFPLVVYSVLYMWVIIRWFVSRLVGVRLPRPEIKPSFNDSDVQKVQWLNKSWYLMQITLWIFGISFYWNLWFWTFQVSCLPPTVHESEQKMQFSLGSSVTLPPESFLSLRLHFV